MRRYTGYLIVAVVSALLAAPAFVGAAIPPLPLPPIPAAPIPSLPTQPSYIGSPAKVNPLSGIPATPQNRFMAPNGESEIHNDAWQSDAYTWPGPLGRSPSLSSTLLTRDCGSIAFDSRGRLISICVGATGPELYMFDPDTLATLATFMLPPRQSLPSGSIFQDFGSGGYFYLDSHDRVVTATTTHHIYVIAEAPGGAGFTQVGDYDLAGVLSASEEITSALPDSNGLLWFVTKTDGVVATLNLATRAVHTMKVGRGSVGEIENSFASGAGGGVYIASNRKMYRFIAGKNGAPKISWQARYPNSFETKPGQVDDGTGTTPTMMQGGYVSITDNADPMDVVVYRTAVHPVKRVRRHGHVRKLALPRMVCKVPVFKRGTSDTENSLLVAGRSIIVENNYGYTGPTAVENGGVTTPGFARVDINAQGTGCRLVWTNSSVAAPTVVPKLSIGAGLIYTYTKGPGSSDPWYWTALDVRTGRVVYQQLAGTGLGYNNNYAGIALSRSGVEYLGTLGGLIAMRDGA
ncbi:MAG TPA: hypothetical protein VGL51_02460 [Solirubrobacteraceae bacterium]